MDGQFWRWARGHRTEYSYSRRLFPADDKQLMYRPALRHRMQQ